MDKSPNEGIYRAKEFDTWGGPGGGGGHGNGNGPEPISSSQEPQTTQLLPNVKPVPFFSLVSVIFAISLFSLSYTPQEISLEPFF